jgi:hypothetical protein
MSELEPTYFPPSELLADIRTLILRGYPKPANENEVRDVDFGVRHAAFVDMSNVLTEAKKQQVIALGRLGWPLRRIEPSSKRPGVRRETAGAYLKAAGIAVRPPGAWGPATTGKTLPN